MLPILKEPKGRPRTFAGAGTALEDILMKHIRLHPVTRGRVFVYKMDKSLPADPSNLMVWRKLLLEPAPQHLHARCRLSMGQPRMGTRWRCCLV
jgi:hypothetical protein